MSEGRIFLIISSPIVNYAQPQKISQPAQSGDGRPSRGESLQNEVGEAIEILGKEAKICF
jgi:hypothetical protein